MTTETFTPVDPDTGEVLDPEKAQELAEMVVHEWAAKSEHLRSLAVEVRRLTDDVDSLRQTLVHLAPVGAAFPVVGGQVVIAPPARRAAQRVDGRAAERYSEQFEAIGIGGWVRKFKPPTAAEVKAHAARLIAMDVDLDVVMPDPGLGDPRIEFVEEAR